MKTETTRKRSDPIARLALVLLGLAASVAAVLLRYAPSAISARNGQVIFRLFRPGEQPYFALPVWSLWLIVLALFALLLGWSRAGRRVVAGIAANSRNLSSALVALALLLLTFFPAVYSRSGTSDQSIIAYLLFGSVGVTGFRSRPDGFSTGLRGCC